LQRRISRTLSRASRRRHPALGRGLSARGDRRAIVPAGERRFLHHPRPAFAAGSRHPARAWDRAAMTGRPMHGATRRVALLSTMAAIFAPLSAKAYYQIWQLISPELVAIGLWVAADDRALAALVRPRKARRRWWNIPPPSCRKAALRFP